MSNFKIEKGVPFVEKLTGKYPFNQMEVGDSFVVSKDEILSATASAYRYAACNNAKFARRKIDGVFRIFRVE